MEERWSSWVNRSTGKCQGLPQHKFQDRWRPGTWLDKAERSDENLIADADGVHIARSIQRRPVQHRWSSQKVKELVGTPLENDANEDKVDGAEFSSQIQHLGNGAETRSLPLVQVVSRSAWETLGCAQSGADEDSIKATAEAQNEARQASSSSTAKMTPSATRPASGTSSISSQRVHQASSSSATDTTTSATADQETAPVCASSAPSWTVSWTVPEGDVPIQPQPEAGVVLGEEGSSMGTSSGNDERAR